MPNQEVGAANNAVEKGRIAPFFLSITSDIQEN